MLARHWPPLAAFGRAEKAVADANCGAAFGLYEGETKMKDVDGKEIDFHNW